VPETAAPVSFHGPNRPPGVSDVAPRARVLLVQEGREVPFGAIDAGEPLDVALVDELCKLRLAAIRQGLVVRLVDVQLELHELLTFAGVAHLAGLEPAPPSSWPYSSMRAGSPNSAKRSG